MWSQDRAGFRAQKQYQGGPWNHQTSLCATRNGRNRIFKVQPGGSQAGDKFQPQTLEIVAAVAKGWVKSC